MQCVMCCLTLLFPHSLTPMSLNKQRYGGKTLHFTSRFSNYSTPILLLLLTSVQCPKKVNFAPLEIERLAGFSSHPAEFGASSSQRAKVMASPPPLGPVSRSTGFSTLTLLTPIFLAEYFRFYLFCGKYMNFCSFCSLIFKKLLKTMINLDKLVATQLADFK